ncbi:MAG: hypothetical protein C3F07_16080 [Anaerolineales bacterium]|nr:MAG: hypothetical protein C3F07_16080 [Anaerolineales bacterium]
MDAMREDKALSLTSNVNAWLANTHQPRILHVFDSACNLINERGEVLSIVKRGIGAGPFNLVIEDEVLFLEYLNVESPISILEGMLQIGDLRINIRDAEVWNPRPDWERLNNRRDDIAERLTQLSVADYLFSTSPIPNFPVSGLSQSLVSADITKAGLLASQIAGLGVGLTPSGDDFLMGAVHAVWIIHPYQLASNLANEIADTSIPQTTSLSAAWLEAAGNGEAGILWHELFDTLILPDSDLQVPVSKILSIGETSGADALTGFLGVFSAAKNV